MNWWRIQENTSLYLTRCPKISPSLFLVYDCYNCWFLGMLFLNHGLVISDLLIRSLYYLEWDCHTSMRKEIILFDRGLHFLCKQYLDLNRAWSLFLSDTKLPKSIQMHHCFMRLEVCEYSLYCLRQMLGNTVFSHSPCFNFHFTHVGGVMSDNYNQPTCFGKEFLGENNLPVGEACDVTLLLSETALSVVDSTCMYLRCASKIISDHLWLISASRQGT